MAQRPPLGEVKRCGSSCKVTGPDIVFEFNRLSRLEGGVLLLEIGLSCPWHGGLKKLTNTTKSRKEFRLLLVSIGVSKNLLCQSQGTILIGIFRRVAAIVLVVRAGHLLAIRG